MKELKTLISNQVSTSAALLGYLNFKKWAFSAISIIIIELIIL